MVYTSKVFLALDIVAGYLISAFIAEYPKSEGLNKMIQFGHDPSLGFHQPHSQNPDEEIGPQEEPRCPAVFFFGAGASKSAGVPTTVDFVNEFRKTLKIESELKLFNEVEDKLQKQAQMPKGSENKIIDIEVILETLERLENPENEVLTAFIAPNKTKNRMFKEYQLAHRLKDFIKIKGQVPPEKTSYLRPLRDLITIYNSINIISTNYDIVVEQFCNSEKLKIEDGFGNVFEFDRLLKNGPQIKLYKIHGSILWYRSKTGQFYKLPAKIEGSIETVFGEKLEPLIIYPIRKWEYAEPTFKLTVMAENILRSPHTRYIFVFGYSFRDKHIKDIFFDIFRARPDIFCILIDPYAYDIYEKELKYYHDNIHSSLNGRVICIPSTIEKELEQFYQRHLSPIHQAVEKIDNYRSESARSYTKFDDRLLLDLAKCNNISAFHQFLAGRSIVSLDLHFWEQIELVFIALANAMVMGHLGAVGRYLFELINIIDSVLISGLQTEIKNDRVSIRFIKERTLSRSEEYLNSWGFNYSDDGFGPLWYQLDERFLIYGRDTENDGWRGKITYELYDLDVRISNIFNNIYKISAENIRENRLIDDILEFLVELEVIQKFKANENISAAQIKSLLSIAINEILIRFSKRTWTILKKAGIGNGKMLGDRLDKNIFSFQPDVDF